MPAKNNSLILFIIDDSRLVDTIKGLLHGIGYTLEFESDAYVAIKKANAMLPDAIVVDADLPQHDEVLRRLRADPHLTGIPILALVPQSDREAQSAAFLAGANDFLSKPVDGLELLARMQSVTRLQIYSETLSDLKRFAWMVEHAQEGYLLINGDAIIQYANDRAINLLNLPEDPAGLNFMQVAEHQYVPRPPEAWNNWLHEPVECFLMSPENARARAVWLVLEALDTPVGIEHHRIVRLRDVTEKMSIYHDIRQFHKAVTHKLRTPVSVMASSLSLINSRLEKIPPEEIKSMMATAGKNAERLVSEIRDILTYIDAPLAANVGEPIEMKEFVNIVKRVCDQLELNNVELMMPAAYGDHRVAMTDIALELVMDELLENSKKFHPSRSPKIDISVGQTEKGFIHIRVVDNGITLSAEQLAWAWLPYFQGEKDFTGELPGMGLGFPLVATLVWQSGGSLHLSNRPDGPGVMVEMKLPVVERIISPEEERLSAITGGE